MVGLKTFCLWHLIYSLHMIRRLLLRLFSGHGNSIPLGSLRAYRSPSMPGFKAMSWRQSQTDFVLICSKENFGMVSQQDRRSNMMALMPMWQHQSQTQKRLSSSYLISKVRGRFPILAKVGLQVQETLPRLTLKQVLLTALEQSSS